MKKIYESDTTIVYRGIDSKIIHEHLESGVNKVLCIYDTKDNLISNGLEYMSELLAYYEILDEVSDVFIINRHSKLESSNSVWYPVAGISRGCIK